MRVAVTGGSGYLGQVVADVFHERGWTVRNIDTGLFAACGFPAGVPRKDPAPVEHRVRDIRDLAAQDLDGCDAVLHLAGLSNDPLGDLDPALTMAINRQGAVRVARAARAAGVSRMICVSSCSVYGAAGDALLTESSATRPVTPYAKAKLLMERDVAALASDGFSPVFLRPATIYGLSPMIRFDLVVNNLVAWACATGEVLLKSDGSAWRPIVHVRDAASALADCLAAPEDEVRLRVFNLVDSQANFRVLDLAGIIAREMQGTPVRYAEGATRDVRNYRVSGQRLSDLLGPGWPRFDLETGIAELLAAFQNSGLHVGDFEGPRYQRLAHLRALLSGRRLSPDLRWIAADLADRPAEACP